MHTTYDKPRSEPTELLVINSSIPGRDPAFLFLSRGLLRKNRIALSTQAILVAVYI